MFCLVTRLAATKARPYLASVEDSTEVTRYHNPRRDGFLNLYFDESRPSIEPHINLRFNVGNLPKLGQSGLDLTFSDTIR